MHSWSRWCWTDFDPAEGFQFEEVGVRRGQLGQTCTGLFLLLALVGCSRPAPNQTAIDWTATSSRNIPPPQSARERPEADASGKPGGGRAGAKQFSPPIPDAIPADVQSHGPPVNGGSAQSSGSGGAGAAGSSGSGSSPPGGLPESVGGADAGGADEGSGGSPPPPLPALPGRGSRRPSLPADQAAELAEANLGRARSALRGGDVEKATQLALEAYDAVAPHASASPPCRKLCADAGKFLESVARKQGRAANEPTRFD